MLTRKWVVIFNHPYYPDIEFFDNARDAYKYADDIIEENHKEDGHHDGYVYVGAMEGIYTAVKTYG